jgi:hypothetical protein
VEALFKAKRWVGNVYLTSVKLLVNQKKKEKKRHFASNKRVPLDKKRQLRASCRKRLYDTDAFLRDESHEFIKGVFFPVKEGLHFDASKLVRSEYSRVTGITLAEFSSEKNFLEFSPPLSDIESFFKKQISLGVSSLNMVPKINMGRISTETHQFDFSEASKALMSLTEDLDDFFTDNFIPLHAFMYFIMSFEHLMFDQSLLVNDELDLLNDSVVSSEPEPGGGPGHRGNRDAQRLPAAEEAAEGCVGGGVQSGRV